MKSILFCLLFLFLFTGCKEMKNKKSEKQTDRFEQMRHAMVENQICARGVKDKRVLNAMEKVPRHKFVPKYLEEQAYFDEPLPIGEGQTISQPYIVAYMTEQLMLNGDERVLEIGTGSGYQSAILAELCDSVFTIEIISKLSREAQNVLSKLSYKNIQFKIGDGYQGWSQKAPFDAIIVTAAPEHIPQPLVEQLKVGGKMIIPVGDFYQELYLVVRTKKGVKKERKLPVRFVPMRGEAEKR